MTGAAAGDATRIAADTLALEGQLLDRRDWPGWLDLYVEDAVYWIPAWRDEDQQTDDPASEVSLIYHDSRKGLEDRVARILSGKSVTAMPLPRTAHLVGNVMAADAGPDHITARASWTVHLYQPRTAKQTANFGIYEVELKFLGGRWLIARKLTRLLNDRVATALDFYSV